MSDDQTKAKNLSETFIRRSKKAGPQPNSRNSPWQLEDFHQAIRPTRIQLYIDE
jgi:hypothetical protein